MSRLIDPQFIQRIRQMDPHWTGAIPTFAPPITGLPKNWVIRLGTESGSNVAWSPGNLAVMFGVPVKTVQELLETLFAEGEIERGSLDRVGLEAILAVGFRVVSPSGVNFRKWATAALSGFALKGYLLDKERLPQEGPWDPAYFEFLLEELDFIRTSARAFHQRLGDLYATAVDYDKDDPCTRALWRKVMSFALDGRTPKPSLAGLPMLDQIMDLFLDFSEDRAHRHLPMTMADWADGFELVLRMKEEDILEGPDEVTEKVARALASVPPQLPRPVQSPSRPDETHHQGGAAVRRSEELKVTANREAFRRLYKSVVCNKDGRCAICGWHKGENRVNYRKHGVRKPRKKDPR